MPCFVKRRSAEWEYVGEYRAYDSTEDPEKLAAFGKKVLLAIFLENRAEIDFESDAEAESFDAQERAAGFQSNPEIRRIVEKSAMDRTKEKLSGLGFSKFKDTSRQECYDYTCERGGNLYYVEVKGTQGSGALVILTKNEVKHGQKYQQRSIFVVVHDVKVAHESGPFNVSGGTSRVCLPWIIELAALEPIQYKWTVTACPALPTI